MTWSPNLRTVGRGASPDIRAVLEIAQQAGWVGRLTKSGHILLRHPAGGTTTVPQTPSDHRSARNALAYIRRGNR